VRLEGGAGEEGRAAGVAEATRSLAEDSGAVASAMLAADWPGEAPDAVLLAPPACRDVWRAFDAEALFAVTQARHSQEQAARLEGGWPPPWACVAMRVGGGGGGVGSPVRSSEMRSERERERALAAAERLRTSTAPWQSALTR
jgi:hypothetical protein